ncbi:MAG: SRPBCC domain-containing protein, partial [Myxococcota bacterium]|nr:SRPBCC domain-containing protein [Myxococcota bacterium]
MIDTSLFVAPGPDQRLLAWQVRLNADPAEVFRTWTTAEGLGALLDAEARVELRIGGPIEVFFMPDAPEGSRGSEGCQFLAYVPDRMLAFSWNAPPSIPETRNLHTWVV